MDAIFLEVLNMSFASSFVIFAVIAMRFLLKKAPKKFSYRLWVVVLFRLLCPFTFHSNLALLPVNPNPISQDIIYQITPEIDTGIVVIDDTINAVLPPVTQLGASVNPIQIQIFAGRVVWMAGMSAMALYGLAQYFLLKRKLATAIPLEKDVYLADNIPSPFVLGLIRPKIYLPSHLEAGERDYIIDHERCHLKHCDHLTRVLAFIALVIHWFNPFAWIAFVLSSHDMELTCDEAVMEDLNTDIRTDYAQSLLRLSTGRRLIAATPLAFGEGETKGRVKNILKYKKPTLLVGFICTVFVCCAIVNLMSNPDEEQTPPQPTSIKSIFVSGDVNVSESVLKTAMEYVRSVVITYDMLGKEDDYTIIQASITNMEQITTGTAGLSDAVNLYKLEYRLTPSNIDNVTLVNGMSIDNGAITEWGGSGQPYLLFYDDYTDTNGELLISITDTDTIFENYGSDKYLEQYGTAFTAYAMEQCAAYKSAQDDKTP